MLIVHEMPPSTWLSMYQAELKQRNATVPFPLHRGSGGHLALLTWELEVPTGILFNVRDRHFEPQVRLLQIHLPNV